jgi:hypothetical protein
MDSPSRATCSRSPDAVVTRRRNALQAKSADHALDHVDIALPSIDVHLPAVVTPFSPSWIHHDGISDTPHVTDRAHCRLASVSRAV